MLDVGGPHACTIPEQIKQFNVNIIQGVDFKKIITYYTVKFANDSPWTKTYNLAQAKRDSPKVFQFRPQHPPAGEPQEIAQELDFTTNQTQSFLAQGVPSAFWES